MRAVTAKLFKNGHNQAVRIPKAYEFQGIDEVIIVKEGDTIVLMPARKSWSSFSQLPSADKDFMSSREPLMDKKRVKF